MQQRNLRVLEYFKILEQLASFASSDAGKQRCLALMPSSDEGTVRMMQRQTEEASVVMAYIGGSPMQYFVDIADSVRVAAIGGTLSMRALLDVAETLRASRQVRQSLVSERENTPLITSLASNLVTNRSLEEEIFNAILSEDEIADRASPELYDIRRHLRQINDRMKEKLNAFVRNASLTKYLQDTIITQRNGRYVIPVKAGEISVRRQRRVGELCRCGRPPRRRPAGLNVFRLCELLRDLLEGLLPGGQPVREHHQPPERDTGGVQMAARPDGGKIRREHRLHFVVEQPLLRRPPVRLKPCRNARAGAAPLLMVQPQRLVQRPQDRPIRARFRGHQPLKDRPGSGFVPVILPLHLLLEVRMALSDVVQRRQKTHHRQRAAAPKQRRDPAAGISANPALEQRFAHHPGVDGMVLQRFVRILFRPDALIHRRPFQCHVA